jgi:Tripartite ATP-independent periplasmic transporter, DctM component
MFLLGFFLDTFEIIFIVVPITAPILLSFTNVDPVWLGVMFGVNLQTSFLTPPFGFSLFYLRGVAPASVTTGAIYRGVVPFVCLQLVGLWLVWEMPSLATWLPHLVYAEAPAAEGKGDLVPGLGEDDLIPSDESGMDSLLKVPGPDDQIPPSESEPSGNSGTSSDIIPPAEQ